MRTTKQVVKILEETDKVYCNMCRAEITETRDGEDHQYHWSCHIGVSHVSNGAFPGSFSETRQYDVCRACFANRLEPQLDALPGNVDHYENDTQTRTMTP